jgi:hypothetical protein
MTAKPDDMQDPFQALKSNLNSDMDLFEQAKSGMSQGLSTPTLNAKTHAC